MSLPHSLSCPRIHLRVLRASDAEALRTASRGVELDDVEPSRTLPEARIAIQTYENDIATGKRLVYGIFRADTGALAGVGTITPTDARAMNIGLWLATDARGLGLGAATVVALSDVAVRWAGADRLELWCDPTNTAMVRAARSAGYQHVATLPSWTLRADGVRYDQMLWTLAASTWTPRDDIRVVEVDAAPALTQSERVWSSVSSFLGTRFAIASEAPMSCELAVEVTLPECTQRQRVLVEQSWAFDQPWLILRAPVGDETLLSHSAALHHSALLAAGALTIERGMHVLRYGVPPNSITVDGLTCLVRMLADEAVRLRAFRAPTAHHHATAFAAFAE